MWEALHMPVVQDEQILFSAVVTAEAIQLVLLLSSGTATNMMIGGIAAGSYRHSTS